MATGGCDSATDSKLPHSEAASHGSEFSDTEDVHETHSISRRRSRRSWFETPPPKKIEIAIENKSMRIMGKRRSMDQEEILLLTHFTNPPKLCFGKAKPGKTKTRVLVIKNPHEYEQEVFVEKFPFKKNFNIEETLFTVKPESDTPIVITWSPEEAGNVREMVLFKVDGVYRLQTFLLGVCEAPKLPPKKKRGLLGSRVEHPLSVLQTQSLSRIRSEYSQKAGARIPSKTQPGRRKEEPHVEDWENVCPSGFLPPTHESTAIARADVPLGAQCQAPGLQEQAPLLADFSPIPRVADLEGRHLQDTLAAALQLSAQVDPVGQTKTSETSVLAGAPLDATEASPFLEGPFKSGREVLAETKVIPAGQELQGARPGIAGTERKALSPNSFLNDSLCAVQTLAPEQNKTPPTPPGLVRPPLINPALVVSPNSFLEESLREREEAATPHGDLGVPSPSSLLNASIPHGVMVKQLSSVKVSLMKDGHQRLATPTSGFGRAVEEMEEAEEETEGVKTVEEINRDWVSSLRSSGRKVMAYGRSMGSRKQSLASTTSGMLRRSTFNVKKADAQPKPSSGQPASATASQGPGKADQSKSRAGKSLPSRPGHAKPTCRDAKKESGGNPQDRPQLKKGSELAQVKKRSPPSYRARTPSGTIRKARPKPAMGMKGPAGTQQRPQEPRRKISPDTVVKAKPAPKSKTSCDRDAECAEDGIFLQHEDICLHAEDRETQVASAGTLAKTKELPQLVDELLDAGVPSVLATDGVSCSESSEMVAIPKSAGEASLRVSSDTVTKDPKPADSSQSERGNTGRRLFPEISSPEPGTADLQGFGPLQFGTPTHIPTSPSDLPSRRSTMTVTKMRPSNALLATTKTALQKQLDCSQDDSSFRLSAEEILEKGEVVSTEVVTSLQEVRITKITTPVKRGRPEVVVTTVEEKLQVVETRQGEELVEKSEDAQVAISSVPGGTTPTFDGTPQDLPTTPLSENTRRSTRVIARPKVLDPSVLMPKRLFPALNDHESDGSPKPSVAGSGDTFELESASAAEDVGMEAEGTDSLRGESSGEREALVREREQEHQLQQGLSQWRKARLELESFPILREQTVECEGSTSTLPASMETALMTCKAAAAADAGTTDGGKGEEVAEGEELPERAAVEEMLQEDVLSTPAMHPVQDTSSESDEDQIEISEGKVFYRISSPSQRAPVPGHKEMRDFEDELVKVPSGLAEETGHPGSASLAAGEAGDQVDSASTGDAGDPTWAHGAKLGESHVNSDTEETHKPLTEAVESDPEDFVDCESQSNADSGSTSDPYVSILLDQTEADLYLSFDLEPVFIDRQEFRVMLSPKPTLTAPPCNASLTSSHLGQGENNLEGSESQWSPRLEEDVLVTPVGAAVESTSSPWPAPVPGISVHGDEAPEWTPDRSRMEESLLGSFITLEGPSSMKKRKQRKSNATSGSFGCHGESHGDFGLSPTGRASTDRAVAENSPSSESKVQIDSNPSDQVTCASVEECVSQVIVSAQVHLKSEVRKRGTCAFETGSATSLSKVPRVEETETVQTLLWSDPLATKASSEESGEEGELEGTTADSENSDLPEERAGKSQNKPRPSKRNLQAPTSPTESSDSERETHSSLRVTEDSLDRQSSSLETDSLEVEDLQDQEEDGAIPETCHQGQAVVADSALPEPSERAGRAPTWDAAARDWEKEGSAADSLDPVSSKSSWKKSSTSGSESDPMEPEVQLITEAVTTCCIQPNLDASFHLATANVTSRFHVQDSPGEPPASRAAPRKLFDHPRSLDRPLMESQTSNLPSVDEPNHSAPLQRTKRVSAGQLKELSMPAGVDVLTSSKFLSEVSLNRQVESVGLEASDLPVKSLRQMVPGRCAGQSGMPKERLWGRTQGRPAGEFLKRGAGAGKTKAVEGTPRTKAAKMGSASKENRKPGCGVPKKPVKGVPQSKLLLLKKTGLPKHPLPYAAKNMYYDERWQEKQERGFVHWLNFILTPPDEYSHPATRTRVDAGSLGVDVARTVRLAPTKELLSVRAYTARRRLNRLRRAACLLYQSEPVVAVICKLEVEVESRRLAVRKDRMLHADIGIKQRILDLLLSYNPLWLRIGLEVVFGELLMVQSNSDVIGMSRFIVHRLLGNPDIAQAYCHPTVPHLYREGYADALSQHTLKKFLLLVYFLDRAKTARLIDYDPCLFCKDSEVKASRTLLVQFARDYLSGEGDITRHLAYLGYVVSVVQTPLDEFDYAVTNLKVDLRDGLRLMRALEFLTGERDLVKALRSPAISRLQKVHNVEAVFRILAARGLDLTSQQEGAINPRAVVDGNRDKTLAMLWKLIFHFQVDVMLNMEQLREEIAILEKTLKVKVSMQELLRLQDSVQARRDSGEATLLAQNERLALLLKWCRVVCLHYGVRVENFTVSFSDGRALCCLVHHYHPGLLPLGAVHWQTSQSYQEQLEEQGQERLNSSADWSPLVASAGEDECALLESLRANERENFKLLFEKVSALGGVPLMVKYADMSGTIPDERVVVTYLGYLCGRLLDVREESRAAHVLQLAWRRRQLRKALADSKRREKAAHVIQAAVREFLARKRHKVMTQAAKVIQACWRGRCDRVRVHVLRQEKQHAALTVAVTKIQRQVRTFLAQCRSRRCLSAAVILQTAWRGFAARRLLQTRRRAATRLQAGFRRLQARRAFLATRQAATIIQRRYRARLAAREARRNFLAARNAVVTIQSWFRSSCQRKRCRQLRKSTEAAIRIQAWLRGCRERRRLMERRAEEAALRIQSWFRGCQVRQRLLQQRRERAALVVQSCFRGYRQRRRLAAWRGAATLLQSCFRRHKYRVKFLAMRLAATAIQRFYRRHRQKVRCLREHEAAVLVVRALRTWQARQSFLRQRRAVTTLQQHIRAWLQGRRERRHFQVAVGAAITLQAWWRGLVVRRAYRRILVAVVTLQSLARGFLLRRRLRELCHAAIFLQRLHRRRLQTRLCQQQFAATRRRVVRLQAVVRGRQCRQRFLRLREAASQVQATWRMLQTRRSFQQQRQAAVVIQRKFRATLDSRAQRRRFLVQKGAAMTLQAAYRGLLVRRYLRQLHGAARTIQAAFRGQRVRRELHRQRCAVIAMQAAIRGRRVRQAFLAAKAAALTIQTRFRSHRTRQRFLALRKAAVILQQRWRARRLGKSVAAEFQQTRSAVVTIQSRYRSYKARKQFLVTRKAALTIQNRFRSKKVRWNFITLRKAAVILQQRWRARHLGQSVAAEFQLTRSAAVVIQSRLRSFKARREFRETRKAALTIQTQFRSHQARQRFLALRKAAVILQQRWRARRLGQSAAAEFQLTRSAAVTIQTCFQTYKARRNFLALRRATVMLQRRFRAKLLARSARREFLQAKAAATRLQAAFRRHRAQREFQAKVRAAVRIQAFARRRLCRQRYLALRKSAIVLQQRWRARSQMLSARSAFARLRQAAVCIQASCRAWRARREFLVTRNASITLQKNVRRWLCRRRYQAVVRAARSVQAAYRARRLLQKDRRQFLQKRQATRLIQQTWRVHRELRQARRCAAATLLQACVRGWLARRRYSRQRRSVLALQARTRAYLCRRRFLKVCQGVRLIQRKWQATLLARKLRRNFLLQVQAAVRLQAAYRGRRQRRWFLRLREAAITLQAAFRSWKQRRRFLALRKAAKTLQVRYRARSAMVSERRRFLELKSAATVLQAWVRGRRVRQELKRQRAAACIQSWVRATRQRRLFLQELEAAWTLERRNQAAILVQSCFRMHCQRKAYLQELQVAQRLAERERAAILVQSYFRMHRQRKTYAVRRRAVRLQALQDRAALTIQSIFRMCGARRRFLEHLQQVRSARAATLIQSRVRGFLQRRAFAKLQASLHAQMLKQTSAVVIQKHVRAGLQRRRFLTLRRAAVRIQAAARGFLARLHFQTLVESVRCIQRNVRVFLAVRQLREYVQRRRRAAEVIQRAYRLHLLHLQLARVKAAVRLQAMVRVYLARIKYRRARQALVCLQSLARGLLVRRRCVDAKHRHQAALVLQTAFRIHQARQLHKGMEEQRRVFLTSYATMMLYHKSALQIRLWNRRSVALLRAQKQIHCIVYVQRRVRVFLARRRFKRVQASVRLLQHAVRGWLERRRHAATIIQGAVRRWLPGVRERRRQESATRIQALWRGWKLRRGLTNRKITRARERIQEATRTAREDQKLGHRTSSALDYLLRQKQISYILEALMHLDVATSLSGKCCERLVEVNAVSVIYRLIRSCNRSVPHMELIKYSVNILLNLVKYEKTQHAVGEEEESAATLVGLMAIFRSKAAIFTRVCLLVGILALDSHYRKAVLADAKLVEKLQSLEALTRRQHHLEAERQARQAKMAAMRSFSGSGSAPQTTPCKRRRIKPAWLLRPDSLHDLPDPLTAVRFVLDNLHLPAK